MKTTSCTEKKQYAFDNASRCGAKTKRNRGAPCRSPAVRGKKRCRMHGGARGSGAQAGNVNAYKHGACCKAMKELRQKVRQKLKESVALLV